MLIRIHAWLVWRRAQALAEVAEQYRILAPNIMLEPPAQLSPMAVFHMSQKAVSVLEQCRQQFRLASQIYDRLISSSPSDDRIDGPQFRKRTCEVKAQIYDNAIEPWRQYIEAHSGDLS